MFQVRNENQMSKEEWLNAISNPIAATPSSDQQQQQQQQQRSSLTSYFSPYFPSQNDFTFWGTATTNEINNNNNYMMNNNTTAENDTVFDLSRDLSAMNIIDDHRQHVINNATAIRRPQQYSGAVLGGVHGEGEGGMLGGGYGGVHGEGEGGMLTNACRSSSYVTAAHHTAYNVFPSPLQEAPPPTLHEPRQECIWNINRSEAKSMNHWDHVSDGKWEGITIPNPQSSMMNLRRGCGSTIHLPPEVSNSTFASSFPNSTNCYDFDYEAQTPGFMCSPRGVLSSVINEWDTPNTTTNPFMFSPVPQVTQNLNNVPLSPRFMGFQLTQQNFSHRANPHQQQPMAFKCDNSYIIQDHKEIKPLGSSTFMRGGAGSRMRNNNFCQQDEEVEVEVEEEETDQFSAPLSVNVGFPPHLVSVVPDEVLNFQQQLVQMACTLSADGSSLYRVAKDQNGCRLLQRIIEEGSSQEMETVFKGIVDNVVDLMMDPFGNYLVQKLLDLCRDDQRLKIVEMLTNVPGKLIETSLNTHGTRVVQKLISTLRTGKQISLVRSAIQPGFLRLIKDLNGNHVIQRCLQSLSVHDNEFIFDAATKFLMEIATHQHGCCVLQRCIDYSTGKSRDKLFKEICKHGYKLALDPFGNYVVQYVIEQENPSATSKLTVQFKGKYVDLSKQKFSSHVVEKCLLHVADTRSRIVQELLSVEHFDQLLQDPYANYVVQSALSVTKGTLHASLVAAVRAHRTLRTSPYCKRLFTKNMLRN